MTSGPHGLSGSEAEFAADLTAVQADDALLDALGGSDPALADGLGDQELNALLVAWRRDIDSEPLAELVDVDTAVRTVTTAALAQRHASSGRRRRLLVPVAVAAAVLAIAFTGTGLAARSAEPGDTLWGLAKVLYSDHTHSVEAAANAKLDLEKANLAIAAWRPRRRPPGPPRRPDRALAGQRRGQQGPADGAAPAARRPAPEPGRAGAGPDPAAHLDADSARWRLGDAGAATASATSIPGSSGGTTSLPGTGTPTVTPPPPTTETTPPPPTTPTTTAASGNDPGTSPRSETVGGAGQQGVTDTP